MSGLEAAPVRDNRRIIVGVLFKLAANVVWWTPIVLFLVPQFGAEPIVAAIWLGAALVSGTLVGRLSLRWLALSRYEARGSPYRKLGVRRFRRFGYDGEWMQWMVRQGRAFSICDSRQALQAWHDLSLFYERLHWAWLAISLPLVVYAVTERSYLFAAYLAAANVPLNIYPILLQRDTRGRLTRLLATQERLKFPNSPGRS